MKHKNPHLQRHIEITEAQQELRNSRLHPKTKKKLNSKIGGLKKGLPTKNTLKGC
jgi:hypothetical protein